MNTIQRTLILSVLLSQSQVFAGTLTFKETWDEAVHQSPEIAAQQHESRASELSLRRAKLHWLPELGLKATAYSTNDPAANFFGILSQRSAQSQDFSPAALNSPGYNSFENVTLGLDLPLFEGGRKAEVVNALSAESDASSLLLELKKRELFSEVLGHYGNLVTEQNTKTKLKTLKNQVLKIISHYSLGSKSNPVGYSGILGLKGLNNRIDAEMISVETSEKTHLISLSEKTGLTLDQIKPSEKELKEVVRSSSQSLDSPLAIEGHSIMESLAQKKEDAMLAAKNGERSRYLPKIGLFGNESLTHGSRDTGYEATAGVYLAWSIFSPDNYNRMSEQEERKEASARERQQVTSDDRIVRRTLNENEIALEKTLKVLSESDQILGEQVEVASRLFQSGSISALQLAEVYNRRADLILNLREVEKNWIAVKGKKAILVQANEDNL